MRLQRTHARQNRRNGFTLIEIIAVIAIIGILAAIAVPKFVDLSGEAKKAAADGTFRALQSATALAFAKHRAKGLTASGSGMDTYISDYSTLEIYLDGGYPADVTEGEGGGIVLQDGSVVTVQAETNNGRAVLTRSE